MSTYTIYRFYEGDHETETIEEGLTLEEVREHCRDPETSSSTCTDEEGVERTRLYGRWFDGYQED